MSDITSIVVANAMGRKRDAENAQRQQHDEADATEDEREQRDKGASSHSRDRRREQATKECAPPLS